MPDSGTIDATDESGLQLPFDRLNVPGVAPRWARHTFALPPGDASAPVLAAAFVTQLARYTSQTSIPLLVVDGVERRIVASLGAGLETPVGAVIATVEAQLRSGTQATADTPAALTIGAGAGDPPPGVDLHLVLASPSSATFLYNANVFEPATIERFAGHFTSLLPRFETQSSTTIGTLPLFAPGEEAAVRAAGEGGKGSGQRLPVTELFEMRAAKAPERVAVRLRDTELTYGELNARANQLARYLAAKGIGRESRVMVSIEPSFDIAIALLAILKVGAVYVPLEPTYPEARIRTILEDTAPALLVTQSKLLPKVALLPGVPVFVFDRDEVTGAADNLDLDFDPEQTAYIYYTSGTTGKPKGVMGSQRNLAFYIGVAQDRYGFHDREVMPAIARFSFSISMFELLSPLVVGGTLLILERDHVVDLARISRTLSEVTFFHAGPALLRGVIAYIRQHHPTFEAFANVRHASSGGDMVPPEVLESLKEIFSTAEVFVIYGCSEIACMGCTYPVSRERKVERTYVGHSFEDVVVRILDAKRNVVPFGIVGEICFSGEGVVKGYLDRPELTREKFVEIDGRRFYCTGDQGRMNPAGDVEILGRRDFQVQLRGMRIELGEIDYALRKAPGVRDAVSMARPDASGEKILVGYVVFAEAPGDMGAVRKHMLDHLPDYMVPSAYVPLTALPLNHNMKVDRHALPAPKAADQRAAGSTVRPAETETEGALVALWRELLQLEEVGIDDNFFELGGHSMLAVRLILEFEKKSGVALDGIELLREPLEALAAGADRRRGRPPKAQAQLRATGEVDECFFFGDGLYGAFHRVKSAPAQALLVVPPLGQDAARSHFVLRTIARKAALAGIPALRFDYFGTGNSQGNDIEGTCRRWQADVAAAAAELARRAPGAKLSVIAVRSGAPIAFGARVTEALAGARILLWDPIVRGRDYVEMLRRLQTARIRAMSDLRIGRPPRRISGGEELVGFTYADAAVRELEALELAAPGRADWLLSAGAESRDRNVVRIEHDCQWTDPGAVEDVLPDAGFSKAAVAWLVGGA